MYTLLDNTNDKTLICFGAGKRLQLICELYSNVSFFERISFIVDNDKEKHYFSYGGTEKPISKITQCLRYTKAEPIVLVTILDCFDIIEQLESIPELEHCSCYIYSLMQDFTRHYKLPDTRAVRAEIKIPKIIHYCWFGGKPIRDDLKSYMETWKKFCPDYEIVRWDESNYDYKQNEYMYEAYKHRKWGFVPDFARLDIVNRFGGIYLDTDVEIIRNLDSLLYNDAFCGFERIDSVNNGSGFGAIPGFHLLREQLLEYNQMSFINCDDELNLTVGPYYQTRFFRKWGLVLNNTLQEIQGMKIYPTDVLSPTKSTTREICLTENTFSIHHYALTWRDAESFGRTNVRCQKYRRLMETLHFI